MGPFCKGEFSEEKGKSRAIQQKRKMKEMSSFCFSSRHDMQRMESISSPLFLLVQEIFGFPLVFPPFNLLVPPRVR